MTQIVESGEISDKGKLVIPMDRVTEFLHHNKGKRIIVTFEVAEKGSSNALLRYYFGYVIPTIQQALTKLGNRLTKKQTDEWLRSISPIMEGKESIQDIPQSDMVEHIEFLKEYCAENLDVYIEEARLI